MAKEKIGGKKDVWVMDYGGVYKKYLISRAFIPNCSIHCHSFYEIEIVISGKMTSITNGKEFILEKGEMICLLPGDFHEVKVEKGTEIFNMSFPDTAENESCINKIFYDNLQKKISLSENELKKLSVVLGLILEDQPKNKISENDFADSLFGAALHLIERNVNNNYISPDKNTHIKAVKYIQNHFRENISLQDVAEHLNLSSQYFCSLFRKNMGITYRQYLETIRVAYAKNIMKSTGISCTAACYESGFNSYSAFLRAFKRVTGTTPGK